MTTLLVWVGIGTLGAVGALARFTLDGAVGRRLGRAFPYGTLLVNLSGAFVLGLLVGTALDGDAYRLPGVGLIGAYTTFSTWMLESHRLAEDGEFTSALLNLAGSLALGILVAFIGKQVGGAW